MTLQNTCPPHHWYCVIEGNETLETCKKCGTQRRIKNVVVTTPSAANPYDKNYLFYSLKGKIRGEKIS